MTGDAVFSAKEFGTGKKIRNSLSPGRVGERGGEGGGDIIKMPLFKLKPFHSAGYQNKKVVAPWNASFVSFLEKVINYINKRTKQE
jgi:hypothetical protein